MKKCPRPGFLCAQGRAFLPEAIFNYVLTVEKYVFALSVWFCSYDCLNWGSFKKRARKSAQNYANDLFFRSCVLIFHFLFMPCQEKTCVKEQKHALLSLVESSSNNTAQVIQIMHLFFSFSLVFQIMHKNFKNGVEKKTRFF